MNIKCKFSFSLRLLFENFLILRKTERDVIKNLYWSSRKVHITFLRFQLNLNFLDRYSKNPQISDFMKICFEGSELFHADGQTGRQTERKRERDRQTDRERDTTKLIVTFRNCAKAPKNGLQNFPGIVRIL